MCLIVKFPSVFFGSSLSRCLQVIVTMATCCNGKLNTCSTCCMLAFSHSRVAHYSSPMAVFQSDETFLTWQQFARSHFSCCLSLSFWQIKVFRLAEKLAEWKKHYQLLIWHSLHDICKISGVFFFFFLGNITTTDSWHVSETVQLHYNTVFDIFPVNIVR